MEKHYSLIYDKVIIKQLKKAAKNQQIKDILTKWGIRSFSRYFTRFKTFYL